MVDDAQTAGMAGEELTEETLGQGALVVAEVAEELHGDQGVARPRKRVAAADATPAHRRVLRGTRSPAFLSGAEQCRRR